LQALAALQVKLNYTKPSGWYRRPSIWVTIGTGVRQRHLRELSVRAVLASNRQKRCAPWLGGVLTADPTGDRSK
jgi:hypothetical protein